MASLSQQIHLPATVLEVETLATIRALEFTVEIGVNKVILEGDSSILIKALCGDQLYPVFKLRWKRPGPISDLICTSCVKRGQAQCPI